MIDSTVTQLVPRPAVGTPRDCGVARVIDLPARRAERLIEPLPGPPPASSRAAAPHGEEPGPLARALLALGAAHRS